MKGNTRLSSTVQALPFNIQVLVKLNIAYTYICRPDKISRVDGTWRIMWEQCNNQIEIIIVGKQHTDYHQMKC